MSGCFFLKHGVELWITGYYDPGWLRHAGSQDTSHILSFADFMLHCVITIQQLYMHTQTDRQTDRRHARSISATCQYRAWCLKTTL